MGLRQSRLACRTRRDIGCALMTATEFSDIWAALFKLRDAITDAETKLESLSGKGGGSNAGSESSNQPRQPGASSRPAAPANPPGGRSSPKPSASPPPPGGDSFAFIRKGKKYYDAGGCANCDQTAYVDFVPRANGPPVLCLDCWKRGQGGQR